MVGRGLRGERLEGSDGSSGVGRTRVNGRGVADNSVLEVVGVAEFVEFR